MGPLNPSVNKTGSQSVPAEVLGPLEETQPSGATALRAEELFECEKAGAEPQLTSLSELIFQQVLFP